MILEKPDYDRGEEAGTHLWEIQGLHGMGITSTLAIRTRYTDRHQQSDERSGGADHESHECMSAMRLD